MPADTTLFAGDSLIAYRNWSDRFEKSLNRGIPGATVRDLAEDADTLLQERPKCIVMMIGINDLLQNRSIPEIKKDYLRLLETLQGCKALFVLSLLPVIAEIQTHAINENVIALNHWLKTQARRLHFTYADLYGSFADGRLGLREAYTVDGIHLNESGYRMFEEALAAYLPQASPTADQVGSLTKRRNGLDDL